MRHGKTMTQQPDSLHKATTTVTGEGQETAENTSQNVLQVNEDSTSQSIFTTKTNHWPVKIDSLLMPDQGKELKATVNPMPKYYKETFFAKDSLLHSELQGGRYGVAGDPVPYTLRNDDVLTPLLLLSILMLMLSVRRSSRFLLFQLRNFFHVVRTGSVRERESSADVRYLLFTEIYTTIILALLFFFYAKTYIAETYITYSEYSLMGMFLGVIIGFLAFEHLAEAAVNKIFFTPRESSLWTSTKMTVTCLGGVLLTPMLLLLAYFGMLSRDFARFEGVYKRADIMPLGAGALAGTTFPIDREFVQKQLNFESIYTNSLDAVSDRDYIMEFLAAASILMVHLSRLSEETILWCSREFHFVELDDAHCTGSSMMPQKKNPDVSELVRGKTGRVIGHLMAMLTTVKGLPLAYNKDLQEDKEGIFDAIDTVKFSLAVYAQLIRGMKVRKDVMKKAVTEDFSNATDLADYLVKKGMPFRKAHAVSGQAVHDCIEKGIYLEDMSLEDFQKLSPLFGADIKEAISPETCVKNRNSLGGTSYKQVELQLHAAKDLLAAEEKVSDKAADQQIQVK